VRKTEIPRIQFNTAPTAGFRKKDRFDVFDLVSPDQRAFLESHPDQGGKPCGRNHQQIKNSGKPPDRWDTNAGSSPTKRWQTKVAVTDAIKTCAKKDRLFKSSMISSRTKVMADNGVLNAAASPAAAPERSAGHLPCLAMPSHPAIFDARAPAI
jgi:hypothetical protein